MAEFNVQQKATIDNYRSAKNLGFVLSDEAVAELIKKEMEQTGVVYAGFESLAKSVAKSHIKQPKQNTNTNANIKTYSAVSIFGTRNVSSEINPYSVERTTITYPEIQPTESQSEAINFLKDLTNEAETTFKNREDEAGALSTVVNIWHESLKDQYAKSNVKKELQSAKDDLQMLERASKGQVGYTDFFGNTHIRSFEDVFKQRRGVKFDEQAVTDCTEKAEQFAAIKTSVEMINQTKQTLRYTTKGDVHSQMNPQEASSAIIKAFQLSGVNSLDEINKTLKDIEQKFKKHPDIQKYGGGFKFAKNKQGQYVIYRIAKSGYPAEATNEQLRVIAKEMGLRLDKALATALGVEYDVNATAEEMANLTQQTYDKYKKEYEDSFAKAYGKKDVKALAEAYVLKQQQGVANIEMGINILSMALMVVPGGVVGTSGLLLKGGKFVQTAQKMAKVGATLTNVSQVASPFVMATMTLRPTELLEQLTSKNGMSAEEWKTWGQGVLQNSIYMAAGMGASRIAQNGAAMYKTKALVNSLKSAGKSTDEIMAMIKANPVKFPNEIVKSFNKIDNIAKALQVTSEVALDLGSTIALNKVMNNGDLLPMDVVNSIAFALMGGVVQKDIARLNGNVDKIDFILKEFKEFGVTEADAKNILQAMDDISLGKVRSENIKPLESHNSSQMLDEVVVTASKGNTTKLTLSDRLANANSREDFVAIRDEIKAMPAGAEKTKLIETYQAKYREWSLSPSRPDIRMQYTPKIDLTNLADVKAAKPKDVMKPTSASTITNPGITFKPNPNGEPAKAYRLIWCDTIEETIAKNNERGIPLELFKDTNTGEYKLGIKHSWDEEYFAVDRESAIVNYDFTAENPKDWAVVAEDEGAKIFSKTYLNKESGQTAKLTDIEPGQGMVIVKNPESVVGASAFVDGKNMTSLEGPLGNVDFARTDVDGHPYGSFNDLVKDITRGKIQANPKDSNSIKFVELIKAGKIEEARQLLVNATKEVENTLAAKPSAIMKPTEATTFGKQDGITFKPNVNPNDPPSNAYKIAWGKNVEETIELNQKNGVPLELVKDESTGEFFLGIKHSWDNEYYRVDRESIIVKYGEGDFAPVAEDNGAHIFTQTYLDAKTGKPIDVRKMKPGEPLQIIKNPNSTVGAVAFEKPTTVTSLEGKMSNVEMARTDVDGHPYGTYEQLAKDIKRGKLVANESDPNSAKFIELVKAGKDAEAKALLKQASSRLTTGTTTRVSLDSPEFQRVKTELTDLYKKKNLTDEEKVRVTELESEVQKQGILVAKSPLIEQIKISMLAKAEPREAFLPDFSNETQLKEMGFTKKEDGKWYHSNSDWYPDALSDKDVVYVFKRDASGKPIDTGFGPKDELPSLYVRSEDFDNNNMKFVQPTDMQPGQIISVKKCASGTFCILPVGTKIFTSEGIVEVKPGEIVNVKEAKNSVHTSRMSDVPDMYKADPLNPASKELFDLINEYKTKEVTMTEAEQIQFQARIADAFGRVNRGQKLIEILGTGENAPKTLKDEYDIAARISKAIDDRYLSRIDCSDFDKGLEEAGKVMDEILADPTLNAAQKQAAMMGVMTHMITSTNLHQHGKGSTPKDVTLALAREKGLPESTIAEIEAAYAQADKGYPVLSEFNKAYDVIGQVIRTPEDYKASINGIIRESMKRGQLICEIRCACDSLRDAKTGQSLSPREGTLAIMKAIEEVKAEIRAEGLEPPKTSFVFLTFRGKGWDGSLPMAVTQAKEAVRVAEENPDMKFGYDVAGPEDTGWGPKAFQEAMDIINKHNEDVKAGRKKGNTIGITMHAGETPEYEGGAGYKSVLDAIDVGAVRIGHGIQLAKYLKEIETTNPEEFNRILNMVKEKGITIEICGVCNIQSIPINSAGMEQHAIQTFLDYEIPVSICTDNDAICGTNISKEYTQFLLTGHSNFMDWNAIKHSVRDGIEAAFIPEADKVEVRQELESRIAKVQKLYDEKTEGIVLDQTSSSVPLTPLQPKPVRIGVIDLFGKKKGIAFSNQKDFSHGELVAGAIQSQLKGENVEVVPIELKATDPEGKRDRMVTTSYSMGSDSYGSKTNLYFNKKSFLKELKRLNSLPEEQKFQYLNVSNIIEVPYQVNGRDITPQDLANPVIREEIRNSLPIQIQHIIDELEVMIKNGTEVYISAGNKRTTFNALSLAKGAHSIGGLDPKTGQPLSYFTNNALVEDFVPIPLSFTSSKSHNEVDMDPTVKAVNMSGIIDQTHEFAKLSKRELRQKVATKQDYIELKQYIDNILAEGKRRVDINFFQYSLAFNLPEKFRYKIYDTEKFIAMFEGKVEQEVLDYIRPMGTHCDIRYKQFFDMDAKDGYHIMPASQTTLIRNTISGTSFAPGQIIAREIKAKKNN